jgi:ectoine hydroxylase-related dioxygenase (phytanoyl-CoA dioxygenase family)
MLREESAYFVGYTDAAMDAQGVDVLGITHRGKRYFISNRYRSSARLADFLFGLLMAEITTSFLGDTVFLFNEQWVVKGADQGMKFAWHQDSGYVKAFDPATTHTPYLTCWCALDDMTEANGTISVLPHDVLGTRNHIFDHEREKGTNDLIGYAGAESGEVITMGAGSIAVFSSTSLHRSGPNNTDQQRRVYLAQYSSSPLMSSTGELWAQAVPFITQGEVVYSKKDDFDESAVSPRIRKTMRADLT